MRRTGWTGAAQAAHASRALLRRLVLLGLLAAGWLLGLLLATTAAGHAESAARAEDGGTAARSAADARPRTAQAAPGLVESLLAPPQRTRAPEPAAGSGRRGVVTDLVDRSVNDLIRTAEGVPGTLHRTLHRPLRAPLRATVPAVTTVPGDTPRALGRPGSDSAPRAAAGRVVERERRTDLSSQERGAAAGLRTAPERWRPTAAAPEAAPRHAAPHRTSRADRETASSDHHGTPVPYAPAAPGSFTAGPAAASSTVAGPAFPLPGDPARLVPHAALPADATATRAPHRAPAREPRHTPD